METKQEKGGMEMQDKIVRFLQEKYNPKAIVLYGSRARGTSREHSDWDIYVLVTEGEERANHTLTPFEGHHLDVDLVLLPVTDDSILKRIGTTLMQAEPIFDPEGVGADLVTRAHKLYSEGIKITEAQIESRKNFFLRMIAKLEDNLDNEGVFFYRLGTVNTYAMRYWFENKKEWALAPREALPVIKEQDPDFYSWLQVVYGNFSTTEKLEAVKKIFDRLFPESSKPEAKS